MRSYRVLNMSRVPVVFIGLGRYGFKMLQESAPLICTKNDIVVLSQRMYKPVACETLSMIDATMLESARRSAFRWRSEWPGGQRVFFDRWYILLEWMRRSHTDRVYTADTDALVFENVSVIAQRIDRISPPESSVFMYFNPPRTSTNVGVFATRAFLENVTSFWNQVLDEDKNLYRVPTVGRGTNPNDMTLFGHYFHYRHFLATGHIDCGNRGGRCTTDYANMGNMERFRTARILPGMNIHSLNDFEKGELNAGCIFDTNLFRRDRARRLLHPRRLKFVSGKPFYESVRGDLVPVCSIVLEDSLEKCAKEMVTLVKRRATCMCSNVCCRTCRAY